MWFICALDALLHSWAALHHVVLHCICMLWEFLRVFLMLFTDSSRQEDAGLPTAFGRGPAEPRIQHKGASRVPQAGGEDDKAGVRQSQEDAEPDRSTPADEPEPVDPAAYDAMTPKQKKLFDLRLKLVSIYYIQLNKSSCLAVEVKIILQDVVQFN